jgi:hypothetical protein
MKYLFALLIILHGLIHLMGFLKAFGFAQINQLTKEISRPVGVLWLSVTILLIVTALIYLLQNEYWWLIALSGVILSQVLIICYWHDAKFGSIANVIILAAAIPAWGEWHFENQYKRDVTESLKHSNSHADSLLTIEAISHLPEPVQRYIIYSGAINKPVLTNFKIKFEGQIRSDEKSEWMPFTTEQYNFLDPPTRLFFMKATMKKIPVGGYHSYQDGVAIMDIRALSLFKVQYQTGREMDIAETVTWFNDLCLFAPAGLIDKRIQWKHLDSLSSKATFNHKDISISAILYFNTRGELVNFVSEDRYQIKSEVDRHVVRFSTPAKNYMKFNGHLAPSYGEAIWHLPEGNLNYGQFHCRDVEYNVKN